MTAQNNCTRPMKPCIGVARIDPCDCRYYYECSNLGFIRRNCALAVIFDTKTKTCVFPNPKICDTDKPWNRCRLDDFGISSDQIQSKAACRKFWPISMEKWNKTLRRRATDHTKTSSPTTTMSTATTTTTTTSKWSMAASPQSVTIVRPTSTENDIRTSRVPSTDLSDFDDSAAKAYIPVIVCAIIALVAFLAIIILWKKRSDVKAFVAGLCCVSGKDMSKSICNPGYENTISTCDTHLDQTTGEHVYNEIPCMTHASASNRPLPQTPPQQEQQQQLQRQQSVRASTFSGFGCPDVVIRKEQLLVQRTNSACLMFDKLTSCDDRSLIDAQERFASEHQIPGEKTRQKNMAGRTTTSDRKTHSFEQPEADKSRTESNRNQNAHKTANQKGSQTANGVGRHRISSGKLAEIKEHSELSTATSGTESIFTSGISQSSLSSEKNNSGQYSGVWNGVSVSRKTEEN